MLSISQNFTLRATFQEYLTWLPIPWVNLFLIFLYILISLAFMSKYMYFMHLIFSVLWLLQKYIRAWTISIFSSPSFACEFYIVDLHNGVEVMLLGFSYNLLLFQAWEKIVKNIKFCCFHRVVLRINYWVYSSIFSF